MESSLFRDADADADTDAATNAEEDQGRASSYRTAYPLRRSGTRLARPLFVASKSPQQPALPDIARFARRQEVVARVLSFFLAGWIAFMPMDAYVAYIAPHARFLWLAAWHLFGAFAISGAIVALRARTWARATIARLYAGCFAVTTACIAMMAIDFGGLGTHALHAVTLLVMVQTLALPMRFRSAIGPTLATVMVFPIVVAVSASFVPHVASTWLDSTARAHFVADFLLVVMGAIGAAAGGHLVWAARRKAQHTRRLGRYRLKGRIAAGGMGEVWLAWDTSLQRDVALKLLSPSRANQAEAVLRFEREAQAASSLRSPHTVRVFDFGTGESGVWFLAMEHLDGADLAEVVARTGPLDAARTIYLARQVCSSLAEAHDRGIVHRDVKPANLFLTFIDDRYDFLKLLDFGVAKFEGEALDAFETAPGSVRGTPAFMSPESCTELPVDARTDVYSLGASMYFLLTGTPPFLGAAGSAVMIAQVNDRPERPSTRRGDAIPADLEAVVMRCLAKEPADRFQSVRELEQALAACALAPWSNEDARGAWMRASLRDA